MVALLTDGYLESANCQREITYAASLSRKIIPIVNQESFKLRGWLGVLVANLFRYDISAPGAMVSTLSEIVDKEILPFAQKRSTLGPGESRPASRALATPPTEKGIANVRTVEEVKEWVKSLGLAPPDLHERFAEEEMDGKSLEQLHMMNAEEIEAFLKKALFGMKMGGVLSFKKSLDDLFR